MLEDQNGTPITAHKGGSVAGLNEAEIQAILYFIQGAVRAFCKNGDPNNGNYVTFALRDLFGGVNYCWGGTPMQALYDKFYNTDGADPDEESVIDEAGKAAGRLLKRVLIEEEGRVYKQCDAGMANGYTWIKQKV